jgi:alpha-ketoglutarate-dependent taurine dioxygenase
MDVLDRNTVSFPWERGDFLVLDNVLSMHGRATFDGPRRILAAMTS